MRHFENSKNISHKLKKSLIGAKSDHFCGLKTQQKKILINVITH